MNLRTINPIESTFVTVRHRSRAAKGPGTRQGCRKLAFKIVESTELSWRAVNARQLAALVRADEMSRHRKLVQESVSLRAVSAILASSCKSVRTS